MRERALKGGCLCGQIRYRVQGPILQSGYCHCRICQKQSGAPVVAWFAVAPSDFVYESGDPTGFRASPVATRQFCSRCGTYLVFREDDKTASLGINTATLDAPAEIAPTMHIYCESRIAWFDTADTLPRHEQGPP